ncbi:MAG: hypothetical protein KDM91_22295, partial [Verrucomicrobiae bacterium]|nr:hypothetical protein [Verrucomicrobiae bacterium]
GWDKEPALFVDLNEPVVRGDKVYYPIVDPSAQDLPKWPKPLGNDNAGVEGRSPILSGIGKGVMEKVLSKVKSIDAFKPEPLPMPVMWIYQLKDGTIGTLAGAGTNGKYYFHPVSGGSAATKENPIVARFAFWTDDETCKLNPNVHCGGSAWATPMASGYIDRESLAHYQPAQHELQRYPGHPATTHLAPAIAPGITDITLYRDNMEMIFAIVPRVVGGGSMSGTRKVDPRNAKERAGLIPDTERLYSSLDELIFASRNHPGRRPEDPVRDVPNQFPGANKGQVVPTKEVQRHLERSKFFLSVVSRAPETTLFNTPRVSIWPTRWDGDSEFNADKHWTTFDRLIRFCAEVGSNGAGKRNQYHFQRYNADSATADIEDIDRNEDLLWYLEKLTRTNIPGWGKSFRDKYPEEERLQILTEIFDYIRSTNLHDDSLFGERWRDAFYAANSPSSVTYTNPRKINGNDRTTHKGHGQVTPARFDWNGTYDTKGLGRFYTLLEMGVVVIGCADGGNGAGGGFAPGDGYPGIYGYPGRTEYDPNTPNRHGGNVPQYSNFPPLPFSVQKGNTAGWPQWLKDLKQSDPALADLAFDE